MAFGVGAPGQSPEMHAGEPRFRTLAEYREQMRQIVRQGRVDIMLMSASSCDQLAIHERLFEDSPVTPAARANDTSDIFVVRGGSYIQSPSRPFRTASLDHIQCGRLDCPPEERERGANLGLYSMTFNNRLSEDMASLAEYRAFREEAEAKGFRHFLEVFDPNAPAGLSAEAIPGFVNDCIARALAGVAQAGRPVFLKVVYHGPRAMEELVAYDPHLIVGILGGAAGTTYDAFKLIAEAQKYGARVALFGRKINNAENQLAFVEFLRLIVEGQVTPEEATRAYHGVLAKLKIPPKRRLEDDLVLQTNVMSYGGSSVTVPSGVPRAASERVPAGAPRAENEPANKPGCGCSTSSKVQAAGPDALAVSASPSAVSGHASCGCHSSAKESASAIAAPKTPDFSRMSQAEKLAYQQAKRDRVFGR